MYLGVNNSVQVLLSHDDTVNVIIKIGAWQFKHYQKNAKLLLCP